MNQALFLQHCQCHVTIGWHCAHSRLCKYTLNFGSLEGMPSSLSRAQDQDFCFDNVDAGASLTYPQQAGDLKKGGYVMIKEHPCKIVELSSSKTGKHGHAKVHFVGID